MLRKVFQSSSKVPASSAQFWGIFIKFFEDRVGDSRTSRFQWKPDPTQLKTSSVGQADARTNRFVAASLNDNV